MQDAIEPARRHGQPQFPQRPEFTEKFRAITCNSGGVCYCKGIGIGTPVNERQSLTVNGGDFQQFLSRPDCLWACRAGESRARLVTCVPTLQALLVCPWNGRLEDQQFNVL